MLPRPVLQSGSVLVEDEVTEADGWVMLVVAGAAVQPLESLTVTVCEPAERLLKVAGDVQALKAPPSRLHV